jgi:DNA mismatch endonuclease (patch repair protein)
MGRRPYKPRDPAVTSRMMAAVRSRENRAERLLRRHLHAAGLRYRLYDRAVLGKPDLVFKQARVAVFVDGDFWHGRKYLEGGVRALRRIFRGERREWWIDKLKRNVARDREVTRSLAAEGWLVLRYWESDVMRRVERIAAVVEREVRRRARRVA